MLYVITSLGQRPGIAKRQDYIEGVVGVEPRHPLRQLELPPTQLTSGRQTPLVPASCTGWIRTSSAMPHPRATEPALCFMRNGVISRNLLDQSRTDAAPTQAADQLLHSVSIEMCGTAS